MLKIYRRCHNSRLVEGCYPLFHKSVVAPLFHPLSPTFTHFHPLLGVLEVSLFGSNMPLEPLCKEKKRSLLPHQKWPWGSNFCEPHFLDLSQKELFTPSFLHCGDELNGLGRSWMGLTHGNVILDILEAPAPTDVGYVRGTFCQILWESNVHSHSDYISFAQLYIA